MKAPIVASTSLKWLWTSSSTSCQSRSPFGPAMYPSSDTDSIRTIFLTADGYDSHHGSGGRIHETQHDDERTAGGGVPAAHAGAARGHRGGDLRNHRGHPGPRVERPAGLRGASAGHRTPRTDRRGSVPG